MPVMLAADLSWIRAALEARWPDTAYLVRPPVAGSVPDGEGGWLPGVAARLGPYPCVYHAARTTETRRGAGTQVAAVRPAQVALPANTDVRGTDQLEVHLDGANTTVLALEIIGLEPRGDEFRRVCQVEELHPA